MWERGWSFIKKAGTIILLSTIVLWFLMSFGWDNGAFGMIDQETQLNESILAKIGSAISWIFAPLGWCNDGEGWKMAVANYHRSYRKRERSSNFRYALRIRKRSSREDGQEVWGSLQAPMPAIAKIWIPLYSIFYVHLASRQWEQ